MNAGGPPGTDAVAHVFVEALDDRCVIAGDDGHHLRRARRLTVGEHVTAADGTGAWRSYEISGLLAGGIVLAARADAQYEPAPRVGVALAVALTKGGLDGVVAAVTELGVARITPMRTEHAVARWDAARAEKAAARLRAVAREAAMQCRRVRVPAVDDVTAFDEVAPRPAVVVADRTGTRRVRAGASERGGVDRARRTRGRVLAGRAGVARGPRARRGRRARAAGGDGPRRGRGRPHRADRSLGTVSHRRRRFVRLLSGLMRAISAHLLGRK